MANLVRDVTVDAFQTGTTQSVQHTKVDRKDKDFFIEERERESY